jgi:hypothetical protein
MNLEQILKILDGASPWALGVLGIIVVLYLFFKHREKMAKEGTENANRQKLTRLEEMLSTHIGNVNGVLDNFKQRSDSELTFLEKMTQELVKMGASLSGEFIGTDNAKRIITYQWSWCRDQTARLLQNSIDTNNFFGNEEVVVRRLRRAWKKVADESQESIRRIKGLKYPFTALYEIHIPMIWEKIWEWAVPIYHSMNRHGVGSRETARDLQERIVALFDHVLATYFEMTEDIQGGAYYEPEDPRRTSGAIPYEDHDRVESRMISGLRDYDITNPTAAADLEDIPNEMKRRQEETDRVRHESDGALEPAGDEP